MTRQRRGIEMGILLLLWQLLNTGLQNVPPVTILTILGQVALYMGVLPVSWNTYDICLSAQAILKWKDYERLIFSSLEHADDIHLYYNMLSFLFKGRFLEQQFGSGYFAYLLGVIMLLTNITYVALATGISQLLNDNSYYKSCAVGFSGVIFALKVLATYYEPTSYRRYFGVRMEAKYAVWAELALIQLMVPNASFIGHLAGILVGVCYTQGPLKLIVDFPLNTFHLLQTFSRNARAPHRNWGSGVSGTSHQSDFIRRPYGWTVADDIDNNEYDEAVRRSIETLREEEDLQQFPQGTGLDTDEIRRRRIERFTRN